MTTKSSAHYQREYRKRLREQGLVKKEVWILPENSARLSELEKRLRERADFIPQQGDSLMSEQADRWTTLSLNEALSKTEQVASGAVMVDVIDGVEPTLHLVMREYGDLPMYLTISGDQIIVEALLWSVKDIEDPALFNEAVLRTHKYFPLSTISLDLVGEAGEYYQMFGALSATSVLKNIVLEIEVLASNVIQATEAYGEFLKSHAKAS